MSDDDDDTVQMIPVDQIAVINPRVRNKRIFNELVTSIAHLGLKKPITVSPRDDGNGYDLVCGQGRLEAFIQLGENEIPALVISASEEDCYIMSLVENLARRQHSPIDLMREIGALRERGYGIPDIAKKTDFSSEYVAAICMLLDHGEVRLITAIERGVMPAWIAIEIARANDAEVQRALADAYESKALGGKQILAIRRIIEERKLAGKRLRGYIPQTGPGKRPLSADVLIRAYRKETDRQKLMVKKAALGSGLNRTRS